MTLFHPSSRNADPGIHPDVTPAPQRAPGGTAAVEPKHVDYDRHPLKVQGLEHYIAPPVGDERFRIS